MDCSSIMSIEEAVQIYDAAHKTPTPESICLLIKATQLLAKQYRRLEMEGLTRNVADRFDEWKHTQHGRRIIAEIGIGPAWDTFKAGGCWAQPKIASLIR